MGDFSKSKSHRTQLSRYLKKEDVVLRGVSALKYLELYVEDHFTFDVEKDPIFAYGKKWTNLANLVIEKRANFDEIDYSKEWEIPCSTLSQVVQDMLSNTQLMQREVLIESLANHYEDKGHFNDIFVSNVYASEWETLKNSALEFYG